MFTWGVGNKGQPCPGQRQGDGTNHPLLGCKVLSILSPTLVNLRASYSLLVLKRPNSIGRNFFYQHIPWGCCYYFETKRTLGWGVRRLQ